jgi:hypothetical protein
MNQFIYSLLSAGGRSGRWGQQLPLVALQYLAPTLLVAVSVALMPAVCPCLSPELALFAAGISPLTSLAYV